MAGDETRVVEAFRRFLELNGWTLQIPADHVDVQATDGQSTLYAEVKGRTTDPGLDADTMYGQLLRRMKPDEDGRFTYAVVVPTSARSAALRVSATIRTQLGISVYEVTDDGEVRLLDE